MPNRLQRIQQAIALVESLGERLLKAAQWGSTVRDHNRATDELAPAWRDAIHELRNAIQAQVPNMPFGLSIDIEECSACGDHMIDFRLYGDDRLCISCTEHRARRMGIEEGRRGGKP